MQKISPKLSPRLWPGASTHARTTPASTISPSPQSDTSQCFTFAVFQVSKGKVLEDVEVPKKLMERPNTSQDYGWLSPHTNLQQIRQYDLDNVISITYASTRRWKHMRGSIWRILILYIRKVPSTCAQNTMDIHTWSLALLTCQADPNSHAMPVGHNTNNNTSFRRDRVCFLMLTKPGGLWFARYPNRDEGGKPKTNGFWFWLWIFLHASTGWSDALA